MAASVPECSSDQSHRSVQPKEVTPLARLPEGGAAPDPTGHFPLSSSEKGPALPCVACSERFGVTLGSFLKSEVELISVKDSASEHWEKCYFLCLLPGIA